MTNTETSAFTLHRLYEICLASGLYSRSCKVSVLLGDQSAACKICNKSGSRFREVKNNWLNDCWPWSLCSEEEEETFSYFKKVKHMQELMCMVLNVCVADVGELEGVLQAFSMICSTAS